MLKNISVLEVKIEDEIHQYMCPPNAQLGKVFDALTQMRAYVIDRMKSDNQPLVEEPPKEICQNECQG